MTAERFKRTKGDPFPGMTRMSCDWRDSTGLGCHGTYFDADDARTGRRYAKKELGWVRIGGKDYCAKHAERAGE